MASSSLTVRRNEENRAFSGIEPHGTRRKVDESSRLFDVFINHRGPDVKLTLALQLYNSLKELGIHAFLDSEEKELGDSFPSTIENAIHSASVHIAIFSKRYAESPWCLAELLLMLQSSAKIIPVFYGVKPSALRYIESGEYAEAFTRYEEKGRYMEKLEDWKEALHSVSFLTGHEIIDNFSDCRNIVSAVQNEMQRKKSLHVAKYPVGLHKLVKDFQRQCLDQLVQDFERHCRTNEGGKENVQIVGVFGMGGVGKTTLAKELFNRNRIEYKQACFLFDVREAYAKDSFPSLQMKFAKDLFQQDPISQFQEDRFNFQSTEEGKTVIMDCINRTKEPRFLIVIDDIDQVQQLDALLIRDMLKKSVDSLIIVTTRDAGVLINSGITIAYNLKGMDRGDARALFCWHALGQPHPAKDYENLVDSFLNFCGGLPLSLQVLGSHVHGKDQNYWSLELNKVSKTLPRDIHQRLKISFDALDYEEQQIFMDIACFFVDKSKRIAMVVWEASGWSAQHALEALTSKCLVQENEIWEIREGGFPFRMHDHLRDLGREMANGLSRSRRLWRPQDLTYMASKGFRHILAQTKGRCFHSFVDDSIRCRITYFLGESDSGDDASAGLLWLELDYIGLRRSIPSWIPLQNLRYLIIRYQTKSSMSLPSRVLLKNVECSIFGKLCLKTFQQSHVQMLPRLRGLQIYNSTLKEFSDLSRIPNNLEEAIINSCKGLKSMSALCDFKKLIELNISNCPDLQEFSVVHLSCLQKLAIHNCYSLKTMSGISVLRNLIELDISECPVFGQLRLVGLKSLERIKIDYCFKLASFELNDCSSLKTISGCLNLEVTVSINIQNCPKLELLPSLERSNKLEIVTIDGCVKLSNLVLRRCQKLKRVTGKFGLEKLFIWHCGELEGLPFLQSVACLETISIYGCGKFNSLQVHSYQNLKQLCISDCPELQELSCCASQTWLEKIRIVRCRKVQKITLPTKLVELQIKECRKLKSVAVNSDHNEGLQDLSNVAGLSCLKRITIQTCNKLQIIQGFDELHALRSMQLIYSSNAAIWTFISKLKSVPRELFVAGKAVRGAMSILNPPLLSDIDVLISEISTSTINRRETEEESGVVVYCGVVVNTSIENLYFLPNVWVQQGEWIITGLTIDRFFLRQFEDVLCRGLLKKGYKVVVKKGEEWKIQHVLHTIINNLYEK